MPTKAIEHLLASPLFTHWHWFTYHFQGLPYGQHTPFSLDFTNRLNLIEHKIPGFTEETIRRMGSISGQEKHEPHYEQLLQLLVEIVIFHRLVEYFLLEDVSFLWEPTTETSAKNPELKLTHASWEALIEVKCPSMIKHLRTAAQNDTQLGARIGDVEVFDSMSNTGKATRPLDNKIKDYLESSQNKFAPFKQTSAPFALLVIAWTQYLFEATSPLVNGMSGLFTSRSFYKDKNGPITFPAVDGVLVTEHLELVLRSTREEPLPAGYNSPLDYGTFGRTGAIHPAYIANPAGVDYPNHPVLTALSARPLSNFVDPRVRPLDYVMWLGQTAPETQDQNPTYGT